MAVLLIGSTGNGKSTLGNFLLDPDTKQDKFFEVATNNLPKTQETKAKKHNVTYQESQDDDDDSPGIRIQEEEESTHTLDSAPLNTHGSESVSSAHVENGGGHSSAKGSQLSQHFVKTQSKAKPLIVIDTPGLNESAEKDLEHMINLVETLQQQKTIQACIFVVKFETKIDQQYKDTIKYYARLLPSLFGHNNIIVLTNYPTDRRSVATRKRQGIDFGEIADNVKKEIIESSNICFEPLIFALDCLPFEEDEQELMTSKAIRDGILSYIFSQREINVSTLKVAKTKALLDGDEKCIKCYEGEIEGYTTRLKEANHESKEILDAVKEKQREITTIEKELVTLKEDLDEKDTNDLVTAAVWSVDDTWKWFSKQKRSFEVESPWRIENVSKWTNGNCKWTEICETDKKVSGVVKGNFMRSLYASIKLETKKSTKYASEIKKLRGDIEKKHAARRAAEIEARENRDKHQTLQAIIDLLEKFIQEKRELITKHSGKLLTLQEAHCRLEEYRKAR